MNTNELPAWPRSVTRVSVTPEHVEKGKPASLTESAAALAISDAIGEGVAIVSVDTDVITAHEKHPPYRHWHAETPEEVDEWLSLLDGGSQIEDVANAARLGLLDFELSWTEGTPAHGR